jgi:hypothetical protein
MGLETFEPHEEAALRDMVRRSEEAKDARNILKVIYQTSELFRKNPMRFIETELRKLNSGIYLLSTPVDEETKEEFLCRMPHTGNRDYLYGLKFLEGSESDWRAALQFVGARTPEIHAERLEITGLLVPKPGSTISRIRHARDN